MKVAQVDAEEGGLRGVGGGDGFADVGEDGESGAGLAFGDLGLGG